MTFSTNQKPTKKKSVFRFDVQKKTRKTLDKLLRNGVDTILVYSVSHPGSSLIVNDSCSNSYPVDSYFFWRKGGLNYVKTVSGQCEGGQLSANDKVTEFILDNFQKMTGEFFMNVIYSAVANGDNLQIKSSMVDHEPKYEIFFQLGDKFKYFRFTDNELTNKESLFYDYNHDLTSYKLFELIKTEIKIFD